MSKYKVLCMSFDGETQVEDNRGDLFDSIDDAWEYAANMGSRWIFYPFVFIVTESGLSIADAPNSHVIGGKSVFASLIGKRVKTVRAIFEAFNKTVFDMNADEFSFELGYTLL